MSSLGIVTIVRGRREHLERMVTGVLRQTTPPDRFVVVTMGEELDSLPEEAEIRSVPLAEGGRLPLAAARNRGAEALDTEFVLFLDVDCIPEPDLVAIFQSAFRIRRTGLFSGDVAYLPGHGGEWDHKSMASRAAELSGRPLMRHGVSEPSKRYDLAWTTSLAVDMATFAQLGGFDERFVGYGAEDTDFAHRAELSGVPLWRVGAVAYHQHHGSEVPPVSRLADIVPNANLFYQLHGWWPMRNWLEEFEVRGLVEFRTGEGELTLARDEIRRR